MQQRSLQPVRVRVSFIQTFELDLTCDSFQPTVQYGDRLQTRPIRTAGIMPRRALARNAREAIPASHHARFGYSALGCQCRLDKGGTLFRRTRYQQGSLFLEERKRGPAVWVYRWWERDINGKPVRRKLQIGSSTQYSTESAAQAAADALRLTIRVENHCICAGLEC
jgi:hypothetical protein